MSGLVHIYTGEGKGKTTCAVGLMTRAYGRGFKILLCQFLKGADSGEILALRQFIPDIKIMKSQRVTKFIWEMTEVERSALASETQSLFNTVMDTLKNQEYQMVVFDEILGAIETGFIPALTVERFIQNKPQELEVILTGRNAPLSLIELSDYVSEIHSIKHPYQRGIVSRSGIEF